MKAYVIFHYINIPYKLLLITLRFQAGARCPQQPYCPLQSGHYLRGDWQLCHHPGLPDQQGDADNEEHLHREPGHLRHPAVYLHHAANTC